MDTSSDPRVTPDAFLTFLYELRKIESSHIKVNPMKKTNKVAIFVTVLFFSLSATVFAHRGRVSLLGCHDNKKTKTYVCHKGQFAGRTFSSKAEMLEALDGKKRQRFIPGSKKVFSGKVMDILEADTIELLVSGTFVRISLANIDSPEKDQPFGWQAKRFTSNMVSGKVVTVKVTDTDRRGRTRGDVSLQNGKNLNRELVKAGLAWWYFTYSTDAMLEKLEEEARNSKRGLWEDKSPLPPWEFVKRRK